MGRLWLKVLQRVQDPPGGGRLHWPEAVATPSGGLGGASPRPPPPGKGQRMGGGAQLGVITSWCMGFSRMEPCLLGHQWSYWRGTASDSSLCDRKGGICPGKCGPWNTLGFRGGQTAASGRVSALLPARQPLWQYLFVLLCRGEEVAKCLGENTSTRHLGETELGGLGDAWMV